MPALQDNSQVQRTTIKEKRPATDESIEPARLYVMRTDVTAGISKASGKHDNTDCAPKLELDSCHKSWPCHEKAKMRLAALRNGDAHL